MNILPSACARRRGVTTPMTLLALVVLITLTAVVFDLGRMAISRQGLQTAGDASALAAAEALMNASVLYPGKAGDESSRPPTDPIATAAAYAEAMLEQQREFGSLRSQTVEQRGSFAVGIFDWETETFSPTDSSDVNAVEVRLGYSRARGNPLPLFVVRWLGANGADVETQSVAWLSQGVSGFEARGSGRVPAVPLMLDGTRSDQGWWHQAVQPTSSAFNDRWTVTPQGRQRGSDGIPELRFHVAAQATGSAWPVNLGTDVQQQILAGLTAQNLEQLGGRLELGALVWPTAISDTWLAVLPDVTGQPRIWPLGRRNRDGSLQITGFAAGQVVECEDDGRGGFYLLVQPCLLQTDTAIVRDDAPHNPWIAKVTLVK